MEKKEGSSQDEGLKRKDDIDGEDKGMEEKVLRCWRDGGKGRQLLKKG